MYLYWSFILDNATKCDIVTSETVEQLVNEIGKIKTQMNNTELQLYEANEKIAELIENVSTHIFQRKLNIIANRYLNYSYYIIYN